MRQFYIGRQPILNASGQTIAYELLFRSSEKNACDPTVSGDAATSQVLINAVQELGLNQIVGKKLAFVNLTNLFLEQPEMVAILPQDRVVLEILETITVNDSVITGIHSLKASGYTIALDDYREDDTLTAIKPLADLLKYDISQYSLDALCHIASQHKNPNTKLLAERVETQKQFRVLKAAGFDLFQGYYFARPEVLSGRKIPSNKGTLLNLLARLNDSRITLEEISTLLSHDVSLSVRALKYVNSPMNGLMQEVTSVNQAAILLGRNTIRHWVTLMLVADINDKPAELVRMALTRARFCQLCAQNDSSLDEHICFTAGLISLLGAMMDIETSQVLDSISATQQLREILLHQSGPENHLLQIIEAIELDTFSPHIELTEAMNDTYFEALVWADKASRMLEAG